MDKVINTLAQKLSEILVDNNKIGIEKQELYKYSALITIQSLINIFATLFLGFVFDRFWENVCFFITYKILRKYSGGLHSSKFSTCFWISVFSNIAILIAMKIFEVYPNYYLTFVIEGIAFLCVIMFAPITNANKTISEKEYITYKMIVCVVSVILIIVTIILCLYKSVYSFSISLAMLLNSVLIIVHILKNIKLV